MYKLSSCYTGTGSTGCRGKEIDKRKKKKKKKKIKKEERREKKKERNKEERKEWTMVGRHTQIVLLVTMERDRPGVMVKKGRKRERMDNGRPACTNCPPGYNGTGSTGCHGKKHEKK